MNDKLRFDPNGFTLKTEEFKGKTIVYKEYKSLPYCTNPVDEDYHSLDILVPVSVDGKELKTEGAPVFFSTPSAGYTATPNKGFHPMGGPGGPGSHADPHGRGPGGPPMGGPGGPEFMGRPGEPGGPPAHPGGPAGPGPDYVKNLCLMAGFTVIEPGVRGRNCQWPEGDPRGEKGVYYGKAPAAMVDLKAAVRYVRHNKDLIPGDTDHMVTYGGSAGGGLSCLLAASGDCKEYEPYLKELGAAEESDAVFASSSFSPVMNLDNGDGAYEYEWGHVPFDGGPFKKQDAKLVDQAMSAELREIYANYLAECNLIGHGDWGKLTVENLDDYMLEEYLYPEFKAFMAKKSPEEQAEYLTKNPWITPDGEGYKFTFGDFGAHAGREKDLPAFDEFPLNNAETLVFGSKDVPGRHFTDFALQKATGDPNARVDEELKYICKIFNPMWHVLNRNPGCAPHWWIRHGGVDGATSVPTVLNLATALENHGRDVNARIIWDGGHCADDDSEGLVAWFCRVCGYQPE